MVANDSLAALRAVRGMTPVGRTPGLDRAVELENTAWRLWLTALGQLVIAGGTTVGEHGAAAWARAQLGLWLASLSDDELDALADDLVAERDEMRPRAMAA